MANLKSSQKAHRQGLKRREVNLARRSALKTSIKKLLIAVQESAQPGDLNAMLSSVAAQLSRARSKKVIKRNAASRTLSRLAKRVARASA
jgi:small subunit ribosomal protein S20